MTVLDPRAIAEYWVGAGGGQSTAVWATAVALAESGGNTTDISPSLDYGLWQINLIHFNDGTINAGNWSDPTVNALEAVKLSDGGLNWAAWCTAWANPDGNCGQGYLPNPQYGSPAYAQYQRAYNGIFGGGALTTAPATPVTGSGQASVLTAWNALTGYLAGGISARGTDILSLKSALRELRQ